MYSAFAYASLSCFCALFTFFSFSIVGLCLSCQQTRMIILHKSMDIERLFFHLFFLGEGGECYLFCELLLFVVYMVSMSSDGSDNTSK